MIAGLMRVQVVLALQTYACYDAAKVNAVNLLAREFPFIEIVYDFDREACCKPHLRPHMEKMAFLQVRPLFWRFPGLYLLLTPPHRPTASITQSAARSGTHANSDWN